MRQAVPTVQDLARQLLTLEAEESELLEAQADAAVRAHEKLRLHLSKLVDVAGYQALLARALALAKADVPWLNAVQVRENGALEGFREAAQTQNPDDAAEGGTALLAQLLGLLVTFVGESLTLRLVRDVWPDAALNASNLDPEETP